MENDKSRLITGSLSIGKLGRGMSRSNVGSAGSLGSGIVKDKSIAKTGSAGSLGIGNVGRGMSKSNTGSAGSCGKEIEKSRSIARTGNAGKIRKGGHGGHLHRLATT
jgi:hypothetical protein